MANQAAGSGVENKRSQQNFSDNNASPPAYSSVQPAVPNTIPEDELRLPGLNPNLLRVKFPQYNIPDSVTSEDRTTVTTTSPLYSSNAEALIGLLRQQATLPPKPVVRIRGTHVEQGSPFGPEKIDFDVTLNIMPLIMRAENQSWNYLQVELNNHPLPSHEAEVNNRRVYTQESTDLRLRIWGHRFCEKESRLKSITLERSVTNWDTEYLSGQIRNIIASTKYAGDLSITFPTLYSKVVILRPSAFSFLGIPKWIGKLFGSSTTSSSSSSSSASKKNSTKSGQNDPLPTVQCVWPYATSPPPETGTSSGSRNCAVQSEQAWFHIWKQAIRNAVLAEKRGWITAEDWMEGAMGLVPAERGKEWGRSN